MSLKELQAVWDELGKRDPLWAVLTVPNKRGGQWDLDDFFRTGQKEIKDVMAYIKPNIFDIPKKIALDFGCGAGRLTQALADHFEEVVGVDISPSLIEQAGKLNRHGPRCRFLLNERDDLSLFPSDHFDFVYSSLTLQHIDPLYSGKYISELLRVLVPGGMLVFQIPERPVRLTDRIFYRWNRRLWYRQERKKAGDIIMEIHGLPRRKVVKRVEQGGGKVFFLQMDHATGNKWLAWKYYVTKPRHHLRLTRASWPRDFPDSGMTPLKLRVENRGSGSSRAVDDPLVKVGAKLFPLKPRISLHSLKEYRAGLPCPLPAGGTAEVEMVFDLGGLAPGGYWLYLDFVREGKFWFSEVGFPPVIKKIKIVRGTSLPE